MISSSMSNELSLAIPGGLSEGSCAVILGLEILTPGTWSSNNEGSEVFFKESVDESSVREKLVSLLSVFRFLARPLWSCCDHRGFKLRSSFGTFTAVLTLSLPSFGAFTIVLAVSLPSGLAPRSCSLESASDSCPSTERSELIRRASLLISMPLLRPLLPRNSPSSSASAASSSSSSSQPELTAMSSPESSTLISTLLSRIHSSPWKPSWRSLPPKIGPSSGCSPSSSSRQSSQMGSRKFLYTVCWTEHWRLSLGSGSLLLKVEPLAEMGERSDDEDVFEKWMCARCRNGVLGGQVNDG